MFATRKRDRGNYAGQRDLAAARQTAEITLEHGFADAVLLAPSLQRRSSSMDRTAEISVTELARVPGGQNASQGAIPVAPYVSRFLNEFDRLRAQGVDFDTAYDEAEKKIKR